MNALQSAPPHSVPAQARKAPELRAYQHDVIGRVRQRFLEGKRVVILQASCGAGKSVMASWIMGAAVEKRKRGLFLIHRRRLITQMSGHLDSFGIAHGVIMAGEDRGRHALVQVASRDTLLSRAVRSSRLDLPPADLIVVDEGHRVGRDNEYARLLEAWPKAFVLILTATPIWPDGSGMGAVAEAIECAAPASQLVKEGYLVPVRCYAPGREKAGKRKKGLLGDPVSQWAMYAEDSPTILFAGKVEAALAARDRFLAAGIAAEHIDASTPDGERDDILDRLASGRTRVLTNVNVGTEGFDVPAIRVVQMLRTAGSYVLWRQATGRAMRPYPGKKDAIVIDHAGAVEVHGFPDEDPEWTLDEKDTVQARERKAKKEGKRREPVVCPRCAFMFSGAPACPMCGHALPRGRKKEQETQEGFLVEADRGAERVSAGMTLDRALSKWIGAVRMAVAMGKTAGMAAQVFKREFKDWPDRMPGLAEAAHERGYTIPRGQQWRQPALALFPQCAQRGG